MRNSLQREIDEWLGNVDDVNKLPFATPISKIVDSMIDENHTRRLSMSSSLIDSYDPIRFAEEFCTIRCDYGRCTGKSTYVKNNADEDSLIIVPNLNYKNNYTDAPYNIFSPRQIMSGHLIKKYRNIYIEEPSHIFKILPQYDLYNLLVDRSGRVRQQTFILLGM